MEYLLSLVGKAQETIFEAIKELDENVQKLKVKNLIDDIELELDKKERIKATEEKKI